MNQTWGTKLVRILILGIGIKIQNVEQLLF